MEVTSPAWTQFGRLHNPPKSAFKTCIHYYYNLDIKSQEEHWIMISRTWIYSNRRRPTSKSLKFMLCGSCEAVMLVWSNILLHLAKLGKKNVNLFFWGKFRVARVPRCFVNYECKGSGVWCFSCTHCTRCGHWYWPLPHIESLIFLWWGKLSSNVKCLFLARNTAPGQRSEPSRPRCRQT
jgi:hypothetical protein